MSQTPPAPQPPYAYQPPPPLNDADQRLWATLIHIGGIFFGILPSLIGYLVLKDRGDFVAQHTRAALNFHITILIGGVIGAVLSIIFIGVFVLLAIWALNIIFSIMAAVAANGGQPYRYPLAYEFVK